MTYSLLAAFAVVFILPMSAIAARLVYAVVRHVVLVGRLRRMCAVRRSEPRPWVYSSKA